MDEDRTDFERSVQALTDIQYLMGVPPTGPMSQAMTTNLLNGMTEFLKILECIQVNFNCCDSIFYFSAFLNLPSYFGLKVSISVSVWTVQVVNK